METITYSIVVGMACTVWVLIAVVVVNAASAKIADKTAVGMMAGALMGSGVALITPCAVGANSYALAAILAASGVFMAVAYRLLQKD